MGVGQTYPISWQAAKKKKEKKKVQIFKILIRGEGRGGVKYLKLLFILVYNIPNVMIFYMLPQKWRGGGQLHLTHFLTLNVMFKFKKKNYQKKYPTPPHWCYVPAFPSSHSINLFLYRLIYILARIPLLALLGFGFIFYIHRKL